MSGWTLLCTQEDVSQEEKAAKRKPSKKKNAAADDDDDVDGMATFARKKKN